MEGEYKTLRWVNREGDKDKDSMLSRNPSKKESMLSIVEQYIKGSDAIINRWAVKSNLYKLL